MKTLDEVSEEKVRGGFYSPKRLVDVCMERVESLVGGRSDLRVLEPSAGDGAFVRGLADRGLAERVGTTLAIELVEAEAVRCREALESAELPGRVHVGSFISWAVDTSEVFDVAVGNPPFVRYQFVSPVDRAWIPILGRRMAVSFEGVSNLWIPVLLGALGRLRPGGAFAFIVPTECLTGISAGVVREWLASNVDVLSLDLFPPASFPDVLQEVLVVSGVRRGQSRLGPAELSVREYRSSTVPTSWSHSIPQGAANWTRFLLAPRQLDAIDESRHLHSVFELSQLAKFEVAAVTGANEFFSVDNFTVDQYELSAWARPLLSRTRYAKGLRYKQADQEALGDSGAKSMLLHFDFGLPDPEQNTRARSYLSIGVLDALPARYKCRIRDPWYRVPHVRPGRLMLSKRSHRFPRVILNDAGVVTTDTIYRGWMRPHHESSEADFVAAFHNSMTLLSAEMEGRSFGGGVLELVPSEVGRLLVPLPTGLGVHIDRLDAIARSKDNPDDSEALVDETDALLLQANVGFSQDLLARLREARSTLLHRRLDRN